VVLRKLSDRFDGDDSVGGFICFNTADPWPEEDSAEFTERSPDDWVEERKGVLIPEEIPTTEAARRHSGPSST